jgi:OOP family OmpA-OmpF porin
MKEDAMQAWHKTLFYAVFGALLLGAGPALAAGPGLYVGASFGQADSDASAGDIGSGFSGTIDDTDTGWRALIGYQFNPNIAIEGAYVDLGDNSASGTLNGASLSGKGSFDGWQVAGVGRVPLGNRAGVFGKVGMYLWDLSASGGTGGVTSSFSDDGSDLMFGAGLDFDLSDNVSLRGEWERFQTSPLGVDLNIDFYSASVLVHFQ